MHTATQQLAKQFLLRDRTEEKDNRSILRLLMSAQEATTGTTLQESEAKSQIGTLLLAGYETTSITLQWVLIEIARNLNVQVRLRAELLSRFPSSDPTSDEINNDLPYLDAVLVAQFETLIEGSGEFTSDTQRWLNAYALDTIGIAGFGHDFRSLDGFSSPMSQVFELLGSPKMTLADGFILVLQPIISFATYYPTPRQSAILKMRAATQQLAKQFLLRDRIEEKDNRSILGLLMSAQETTTGSALLESEATSQIGTLILGGYETTSLTLQWVLIELARNPDIQAHLRAELMDKLHGSDDPTFDQISNDLPYLDAVITEILRLHPAIGITLRTAVQDDIIPLSVPITLADGTVTDKIVIAKGESVTLHNELMNQARSLWGADAKEFRPERGLESLPKTVQEIPGYRHTLTFLDGPKSCLGRSFAVANMKVFLAHVLRRFAFELPEGPETEFEEFVVVTIRIKTKGQTESKVPMRIRRVE